MSQLRATVVPKHLTLMQRRTLDFIRTQAAQWMRDHGGARLNCADPAAIGKALGGAAGILQALIDNVPPESGA